MSWGLWVVGILAGAALSFAVSKAAVSDIERRQLQLFSRPHPGLPAYLAVVGMLVNVASLILLQLVLAGAPLGIWVTAALPCWLAGATLPVIALIDARVRLIPNRIILPLAGVFAALNVTLAIWARNYGPPLVMVVGALCLYAATFAGLGMGDVKLGLLISAWLGLYGWFFPLVAFLIASLLAAAYAFIKLCRGKASLKTHIAFGPAFILGAWAAWILMILASPSY